MATRERIHQLVDTLPESDLEEIEQMLEQRGSMSELLHVLVSTPIDDELESREESNAVAQAYVDVAAGRVLSHQDVLHRLSMPE